jgi:hypothetical protein
MANPNIVNTTSLLGKTDVQIVGNTLAAITTNSANSGKVFKINLLQVANVNGDSPIDVNVSLRRSSTDYYLAKTVAVPADGTLVIVGKENTLYLNEGDALFLAGEAPANLHAVCSYEIIEA